MLCILIASDRGYLCFETVKQLHRCGFRLIAAASDTDSQLQLEGLGIETLMPTLPQWPREKAVADRPRGFLVPETWKKALKRCDVVIYSPEPEADWQAFAPEYNALTWPVIELETATFAAKVPRMICLNGGKSLGYTRSNVVEEWDGISFAEKIEDRYEFQRGTLLPERLVHQLYLTFLYQRKKNELLEFFVKPPVTEIIFLEPEYFQDPERERSYDARESHASVDVTRFRMLKNYDTDRRKQRWPAYSLLDALRRLLRQPV